MSKKATRKLYCPNLLYKINSAIKNERSEFSKNFKMNQINVLHILFILIKNYLKRVGKELFEEIQKEINQKYIERCISLIITKENEKVRRYFYFIIQEELENLNIDDGQNYSFSDFSFQAKKNLFQ
jgi:hypothetical protein